MCTLEPVQGPLQQPLPQGREPALQVKPDLMWKWEGRAAGRKALSQRKTTLKELLSCLHATEGEGERVPFGILCKPCHLSVNQD